MNNKSRDDIAALGSSIAEGEGAHLVRLAKELGDANRDRIDELSTTIYDGNRRESRLAAEELGSIDDIQAVKVLRSLLEGLDPSMWELAIFGLRQSKEREGWLCLESVALAQIPLLADENKELITTAASRLLMMGRTKTMDRLFRASDGHSRSIPQVAAVRFVEYALSSLESVPARVLSLRLGTGGGQSLTPQQVAKELKMSIQDVRNLEAEAWQVIQAPRSFEAINGSNDTLAGQGGPEQTAIPTPNSHGR